MAAASQQVLKEYLLSLGFKIDETSNRKFDLGIGKLDFSALSLAKRLAAAAVAAQAMVAVFSRSMEKLYYSSIRAESSAGNMKALEFAAERIGVSGDTMRSAIEGMARALRTNPGMQGLLESLGVQVQGRERADVLLDFVTQLRKMPFYQASQYASMFGINPDDLLLMERGLKDMKEARDMRLQMAQEAGLDVDKAAAAGKEYMNGIRELTELVGILKDTALVRLLPAFNEVATVTKTVLKDWIEIVRTWNGAGDFFKKLVEGVGGRAGGARVTLTPEAQKRIAAGEGGTSAPATSAPSSLFERLEKQFGLPPGLLDKMWLKESSRGKKMLSPAGAKGHFGFMDPTAKEMGLKDPNNLDESAKAAAEYMQRLMQRYGGDLQKALAAYNWGMGNVDKLGKPGGKMMPWETQDYVNTISGRPMAITNQQTNTFHIAAADPTSTATAVSQRVDSTWADITRNAEGAVR